ncbi:MAG: hypothetical protein ACAF41_10825 [Leptolyngbya sp. BL-A-14]
MFKPVEPGIGVDGGCLERMPSLEADDRGYPLGHNDAVKAVALLADTLMKRQMAVGVSLLLSSTLLPMPAFAGRYVLNQSPQTVQRYFGRPIATVPGEATRLSEMTYRYNPAGLRRVLPKLPKGATFQIGFAKQRVQSLWLDVNARENESFSYGRTEASQFFTYIFGYQPPRWQPLPLPNGGGGHEGFIEYEACLGDGVATSYISYRLGEENIRLFYSPLCETAALQGQR